MPSAHLNTSAKPERASWEEELPRLMVRYQSGEAAAVDELVGRLSGPLMHFMGAFGRSKQDTEDLFQECWIRIHNARHTYRPTEPVLPWIFAIARHTRLDDYRKRRRRESKEMLMANPPEITSRPSESEEAELRQFEQLLAGLPESQREVIFLLKVSGMSLEEVARSTSSTVGAIKQKAHRAYEKLRQVLEGKQG